jgi:hypothetical protein
MAVGRISGPLLKANLIRNGIDLSFETDLLYLDVNNQRIGVKNTTPQYELDVTGTTRTTELIVDNIADIADINISGNTISTTQPYLNLATLDSIVALNKIRIDSIDIEGNAITTNDTNANLEFRPNGTGSVDIHSDLNVDGNIHATGNITADGNITIGDADTDNVVFNAEIASNLIPDIDRGFDLGSDPNTGGKEWRDIYVNRIYASSLQTADAVVGGIDLTLRHNNTFYVAENGDDTKLGNHILDPFATLTHALSVATVGDTIHIYPGTYEEAFPLTIPAGVTVKGEGIRSVTIRPTAGTNTNDAFLLNGETTVEDLTITGFYSPGYAFKYAPGYTATSRSPYIRNITVITEGSSVAAATNSPDDPRGFNDGDAGKGVFLDGAVATSSSANTALLFHSVTFICPGVDAVVLTNGARVEWLNSFTYFANRSIYAYDSPQGRRNAGKTKLTLSGITGTFTAGNTLTITSTDASTVLTGTIDSVDGNDVYVSSYLDLAGFDLTPQSITDGTATATTIDSFDLREFGAEVRLIASAAVYGNFGLVGEGPGVIMYAIGQNLAYIGNGKEVTNDPTTVIQANEIVEIDGARIRYNSVDHKGDFRVGDLFYVNQETGSVTFAVSDFEINTQNGVTFTTGADSTFIDGTKIETGDWRISGKTVETLTQDANFEAGSGEITLDGDVNVTGSLDVTGDVTIGGNITIGDEATDTIQIIAGIDSDIIPKVDRTYDLGTATKKWNTLYVNNVFLDSLTTTGAAQFEEILIEDNFITTTSSNVDLELRASGTGQIVIPDNDVQIVNDLTVDADISANNINISGTTTSEKFSTGDILIDDNYIETTTSNSDLTLRAAGTGRVYIPSNNVYVEQDFTVAGTSNLTNTTIQGNLTQVGNTTQTGNINLTGNLGITGDITVSGVAQFEEIKVETNFITTTESNADIELRATQFGDILIPNNNLHITNDLIVDGTITVGDINSAGTITANRFSTGDILIDDNFITTTLSNSNLELRANGTGEVYIPSNDVVIDNNLTVNGNTNLKETTIVGDITHTGNTTQTGDINLTGNLDVTGEVIISASLIQFEDIQISGNRITTTESNSNLDLRANGTGQIYIPDNNVVIENNLAVNGTITVGNITSSGTITANSFSTGDILIDDNYITTTLSNSNLELRANGTGSIIIDTFTINDTTITSSGDFNITPGSNLVNINSTGALKLPVGTTLERPTESTGQIRYNTDLTRFEGYNGTNWINLKGVEDLDGDTRITAEATEGANDGIVRFYVNGSVLATIDSTRLTVPQVQIDDIKIDGNVIETTTANTDLEFTANGTGTINFDNFAFKDSSITNTVTNSITTFSNTGDGYVKFGGSYGVVLPIGTSGQRPPLAYTETGQMRFNTQDSRVEIWDGSNWVSVAGSGSGITRGDAEEIALATVLVLG